MRDLMSELRIWRLMFSCFVLRCKIWHQKRKWEKTVKECERLGIYVPEEMKRKFDDV